MKVHVLRKPIGAALPFVLDDIRSFLRLGDLDELDNDAQSAAEAAAAEIEQFAQLALLTQTIVVTVFQPNSDAGLNLPVGPVADGDVPSVEIDGVPFTDFEFVGGNRPYISWSDAYRNLSPSRMTIEYLAGFGASAADIPADLARAIMDQAGLHFDGRSPMASKLSQHSPHMARIAARYRGVQL